MDDYIFEKQLKRRMLRIAKNMSPKDTENLSRNAIRGRNWNNKSKFTINYSGSIADYTKFVEEGTKYQKAQRFIERTALLLTNILVEDIRGSRYVYDKRLDEKAKRQTRDEMHRRKEVMYKSLFRNIK